VTKRAEGEKRRRQRRDHEQQKGVVGYVELWVKRKKSISMQEIDALKNLRKKNFIGERDPLR